MHQHLYLHPPTTAAYSPLLAPRHSFCVFLRSQCRTVAAADYPDGESEVKGKKREHGLKGRRKTAIQRFRMSRSHTGKKHSQETRAKISQSMRQRKTATSPPDLLNDLTLSLEHQKKRHMDYFVMEKAVLELTQLRRDVSQWLRGWYSRYDRKPSLEEVARMSPEIHNKFLRYIALQGFIRSNS